MKVQRTITLRCLAVALLALCAAVVSAQNNNAASSTQPAASSSNAPASSGSATASPSASASGTASRSGSANITSTGTSNVTSTASSTSTTPTTFPIASVPSTGYLAGTANAPVPAGASGATGTAAMGPNDSHVVSAAQMLRAPLAMGVASMVAFGVGVWVLL